MSAWVRTDLHGHTLFSDGRATPEEYVAFRREQGMAVIAVSDHDVFDAVRRAALAASRAQMVLVPAAEITAFLSFGRAEAEQFHVLAYFPLRILSAGRLEQTFLYRRGLQIKERWRAFVLSWLADRDVDDRRAIDPHDVLEGTPAAGFPALQSMIDRIIARRRPLFDDFREHHVRFWNEDRELFGWTPEEAIDAIRADGAYDVVAHAARYRDKARTQAVLEYASGIEAYTSRHRSEIALEYRAFAEARQKLWTASSDDHQNARYMRPAAGMPVASVERLTLQQLPLSMISAA
ncbi:MAG: PHP domain-containing protein [Polyangiaceae bacterium]